MVMITSLDPPFLFSISAYLMLYSKSSSAKFMENFTAFTMAVMLSSKRIETCMLNAYALRKFRKLYAQSTLIELETSQWNCMQAFRAVFAARNKTDRHPRMPLLGLLSEPGIVMGDRETLYLP